MLQTKWMHGAVKYLFSSVGEVCKVCKVVFVFLRVGGHNVSMVNFRRVMQGVSMEMSQWPTATVSC